MLVIREQQVRRLLPLIKLPGPQQLSDMCPINVPAALMEQYLAQLKLHDAEGRAAVAQKLHTVGPRSPVFASLRVGVSLPGVVACWMISVGN